MDKGAEPHEARPLGATPVDGGVEFAVWSEHAERIEIVLFDEAGENGIAGHALERGADHVHRATIAKARPGTRYGLRATGPYEPASGHRFDPSKLLVDPYALTLDRPFVYDKRLAQFGVDTATLVPKAIVSPSPAPAARRQPSFRPGGFVYEIPVKPFTRLHPEIPDALRGTVAALAHPAAIAHFRKLKVDAVELMPVAAWIDERHLPPLGLTNGWGYNPVTMMALDPRLAPGGIAELGATVDALHAEGIDVFLDVVFNHTGESDADGPTLSLRGLDNAVYYRHAADDPGLLVNDTGCGNTLACDRPAVGRLILDTMRRFVRHAGIDGFRFDLAPILGRDGHGYSPDAALFAKIAADPWLADRILIAEPWDIGPDGYQLGNFPAPFLEWNDRYRDDLRRFWRGDAGALGALATRLAGSSDIFRRDGDTVSRSVDFIAAHDGMALADIVAYAHKHNETNGEDNRDGHDENLSWNEGTEGPSRDAATTARRRQDIKALIASLFASRGTIMLTAGDEFGRTQKGNNNAYAQDNETTWLDWAGRDTDLEDFTAHWAALRQRLSALGSAAFLDGKGADKGDGEPDVVWLHPDGHVLAPEEWQAADADAVAMVLASGGGDRSGGEGRTAILFNRADSAIGFVLPSSAASSWRHVDADSPQAQDRIIAPPRSVVLAIETAQDADSG